MSADEAWRQTMARAEILLQEGEAAEDMSVIADAVSGFNAALKLAPRPQVPLDWAKTQSRLSAALRALAARIDDPVMLHAAMTACDAALEVYSPRTTPQDWARTMALLGAAQVNISTMQVSRRAAGAEAIMLLAIDRAADLATLDALRTLPGIHGVRALEL